MSYKSSIGNLIYFIEIISLSVTVLSSNVSKSIVIANGIPISSVLEYLLPIALEPQSLLHIIPFFLNYFSNLTASSTSLGFLNKGKNTTLYGVNYGGK